jgi:hypothetical protein
MLRTVCADSERDPSGVNAGDKIEGTLRELAPNAEIIFARLAVTSEQIANWNLPTRPPKKAPRGRRTSARFRSELDAIDPNQLRAIAQDAIERHLPADQFEVLKAAEEAERKIIRRLVDKVAS